MFSWIPHVAYQEQLEPLAFIHGFAKQLLAGVQALQGIMHVALHFRVHHLKGFKATSCQAWGSNFLRSGIATLTSYGTWSHKELGLKKGVVPVAEKMRSASWGSHGQPSRGSNSKGWYRAEAAAVRLGNDQLPTCRRWCSCAHFGFACDCCSCPRLVIFHGSICVVTRPYSTWHTAFCVLAAESAQLKPSSQTHSLCKVVRTWAGKSCSQRVASPSPRQKVLSNDRYGHSDVMYLDSALTCYL